MRLSSLPSGKIYKHISLFENPLKQVLEFIFRKFNFCILLHFSDKTNSYTHDIKMTCCFSFQMHQQQPMPLRKTNVVNIFSVLNDAFIFWDVLDILKLHPQALDIKFHWILKHKFCLLQHCIGMQYSWFTVSK